MCYNMARSWERYAENETKQSQKADIIWFYLYEVSRVLKFTEGAQNMVP